jgi:hypothetical protein
VNQNLGQWNIWTADGLLAGWIFRENRDPKHVFWQMREHERGMAMDDVTLEEEHFHGFVCRTREDGKYYAVAGKNHASLVEIQGLDEFKRLSGKLNVTGEDIARAQAWERVAARSSAKEKIKLADCYRAGGPMALDGEISDWENVPSQPIAPSIGFRMVHDGKSLYILYEVSDAGPLKNSGNRWDLLFKSGAGLDLLIATDEKADPARQAPMAGDKRLLMTLVNGKPQAVLYDFVVPDAPADKKWHVASPVGETTVDVVRKVDGIEIAHALTYRDYERTIVRGYLAEVRIPMEVLGLEIRNGLRLRMDCGILEADRDGVATVRRAYWGSPMRLTVSDIPSEARVMPDIWGWIRFIDKAQGPTLEATPALGEPEEDKGVQDLIDDMELE